MSIIRRSKIKKLIKQHRKKIKIYPIIYINLDALKCNWEDAINLLNAKGVIFNNHNSLDSKITKLRPRKL